MSDTTYKSNNSSSYTFWTWLIAIILAIYLFWAWQHDRFSNTCCADATTSVAAPVAATASTPFSFSAGSMEDYVSSGDGSDIAWTSEAVALKDWLNGGTDWKVEGDATSVTLTGTVDSQATKDAKGDEAQAFFGKDVTINNLLTIATPEPVAALVPENAVVYFATSVYELPADGSETLAGIVEWTKNNPEAKVVISGFHDPRGDKEFNIMLSKKRAESVYNHLVSMGVNADNIEMRKPQNVEGSGSYKEARRAEVSIE